MQQNQIVKISRPHLPEVLARKRVFKLLDAGRTLPVTWLSGPGGSGKTTAVAGWLDERKLPCIWYQLDEGDGDIATFFYYMGLAAEQASPRSGKSLPFFTAEFMKGIPTFTKRYFEQLCTRLTPPSVIVFDNYHHVASDSIFHDVVREALSVVPEGINVIINSRGLPPPALIQLNAYHRMHFIGWDELRFDLNETRELIRMYRKRTQHREMPEQLYRLTEGWAAGLVLIMERFRSGGFTREGMGRIEFGDFFDYFATELFEKAEAELQVFLLRTSFLPRISPEAARELTGNAKADALLGTLSRNNFFTERHATSGPMYQYHILFREFLQARARELFAREELLQLLRQSAAVLEETGQIEDAAELYRRSAEWERFIKLVLTNARVMLSQGRTRTLEGWLQSVPGEHYDREPWLPYWMGLCRMPYSLDESRSWQERAYEGFKRSKNPSGMYLSWSDIVDTYVYEWGTLYRLDHWIAEFEAMRRDYPALPSPDIEARVTFGIFGALMHRQTHHPDLPYWANQVREIVNRSTDIRQQAMMGNQLVLYYLWWNAELPSATLLVDRLRKSIRSSEGDPFPFILWCGIEGIYYWLTADFKKSLHAVNEGTRTADDTGMHIWDFILYAMGTATAVSMGDAGEAATYLEKMGTAFHPKAAGRAALYHYFAAFVSLLRGDLPLAAEHGKSSFTNAVNAGFPFAMAHCSCAFGAALLERGDRDAGLHHIALSKKIARSIKCTAAEYVCLISEAWFFLNRSEDEPGREALAAAMKLGRIVGYPNHPAWRDERMAFLYARALEGGIEPDYVLEAINKRELSPPDACVDVEGWPWYITICCLGPFKITLSNKPVDLIGKVQKKPLELLKVLLALGGRKVSEQQVIDALWPDVDGDAGYSTFKSTLHRLRKMLGREDSIELQEKRVSLNQRLCHVDAQAFERMIEQAEAGAGEADFAVLGGRHADVGLLEKAITLYRGHFLEKEEEKIWAISSRERLRAKYNRIVNAVGMYWFDRNEPEAIRKAIACFERGLEIDDVAEEFYRNLMICHQKSGNRAEGVKTYERCRAVLSAVLGINPAEKTECLYRELKANG